jgi:hypothetical protein
LCGLHGHALFAFRRGGRALEGFLRISPLTACVGRGSGNREFRKKGKQL